jgi:hypothetical protein
LRNLGELVRLIVKASEVRWGMGWMRAAFSLYFSNITGSWRKYLLKGLVAPPSTPLIG